MKKKTKVVGKAVRIEGERALEYERRDDGTARLVGVRRLHGDLPLPDPDLESLKLLDIIEFNRSAERAFVQVLDAMCEQAGEAGVSVRDVRAECAYRLHVSIETTRRYIEKYTAPSAPYCLTGGVIRRRR